MAASQQFALAGMAWLSQARLLAIDADLALLGSLYSDPFAVYLVTVEVVDRGLGFARLWHLDKTEALRLAGLGIVDDHAGLHRAERLEEVSQFFSTGCSRHVPNKQAHPLNLTSRIG